MTAKDLEQFKAQLLEVRARVRGDVSHLTSGALDGGYDSKSPTHMAELGTETFEQDFSLGVMERDQDVLGEIDDALKRIAAGTYGQCPGCLAAGKSPSRAIIPKLRLRAVPYARECVDCARRHGG